MFSVCLYFRWERLSFFFEAGLNLSIILKIKYNSFRDFCQLLIDEKRRKT